MKKIKDNILPISIGAIILVLWQILVPYLKVPHYILPKFSDILVALWQQKEVLMKHSLVTLSEAIIGLLISVLLGIICAFSIYRWKNVKKVMYPIIIFSQTIPIVALSPIMVMWFGYSIWSKVMVVILFCFFPITVNTLDGLNSVDKDLEEVLYALGGKRQNIFFKLHMRSTLPNFLSGFKVAATYSVGGATIGEWLGAENGLGIFVRRASGMLQSESVFAGVIVLSLLGLMLFSLGALLEKKLLKYKIVERGDLK